MADVLNIAGYRFCQLDKLHIASIRQDLIDVAKSHLIKGSILLSSEGINCFLAGRANNLEKFIMKSEQSRKNFEDLIVESSKVMVKINNEISIRVGQYNKNELANVDSLNKIEEQLRGLREQINNKNNNNNDDLAKEIQVLAKTISLMNK